jgi:hypothetical protein
VSDEDANHRLEQACREIIVKHKAQASKGSVGCLTAATLFG